jgi:ABC-type antimicrobial peptide transport system permease subunit
VIFASLATLLAALGLYGVLAYNVARRTREIGIRMALGAEAGHVRALVIREVLTMLAVGTAIGIAGAIASGKIIEQMLYNTHAWNPVVFAASATILWTIALAAAYMPLRRAVKIDPLVALRYE